MSSLEDAIVEVLNTAAAHRATQAYLVNELDIRRESFSVEEFDKALQSLREDGTVRIHNPRAAAQDRIIEYRKAESAFEEW
jgi:hypothetical protein